MASGFGFFNRILCLPGDDLYQDVLFDSATCDVGFVKGLRLECSAAGLELGSSTDLLRLIDVTFAMSRWHVAQEAGASISDEPRLVSLVWCSIMHVPAVVST
jgi:hypothetical protein